MNNKLLKFLVCPVSKDRLVFDKKNNMLVSKKAKLAYSIKEGIPILLKEQAKQLSTFSMSNNENAKSPEMSFDKQWILKKLKLLEPVLSSGKTTSVLGYQKSRILTFLDLSRGRSDGFGFSRRYVG